MYPIGKLYRIGELAEIANVSKRTIDYYTQLGLLTFERTDSNYRHYSEESLQRLKLIELFKKEKLSLEEIRERLHLLEKEHEISDTDVSRRIREICSKMHVLEDCLLELKPMLAKLNEHQLRVLSKQISVQSVSLIHTLNMLFGENPPI